MLINFSVGNFRSFKEPVTFSMVAANITAKNKDLDTENVFSKGNISLLKSAAIYGANASGKSNLFQAITFMKNFVLHSPDATSKDSIAVEPFLLSTETREQPSFFEIIFFLDDTRYRYGFEINQDQVKTEWLYQTIKRETQLFWRETDQIMVRSGFKEGKGLEERTRLNALFLSVVDRWNGQIAGQIVGWFKKVGTISSLDDTAYLGFTIEQVIAGKSLGQKIVDFIRHLDLGISDIKAEKQGIESPILSILQQLDNIPDELKNRLSTGEWFTPIVRTYHTYYNLLKEKIGQVEFDLDKHESEGTKKAFALSGPILHALQNGRILLVDEIDARIHPLMTRYIIELFNSTYTNPQNAQLIFVTHDTNLLDNQLFRRDQIWFTEKDRYGATDLYSLIEYKLPIRYDASFESDYMTGKYGAVPYIGNIKRLIGEEHG